MRSYPIFLSSLEDRVTRSLESRRDAILRAALAVIYIWFGALKPFGLSPADQLASATMPFLPAHGFVVTLGAWEVAIGICFLFRPLTRLALVLFLLHMPGTFLPMLFLPEHAYTRFPYGLTLEGQYIVKNVALICAAIVVWVDYKKAHGFAQPERSALERAARVRPRHVAQRAGRDVARPAAAAAGWSYALARKSA